MMRLGVSRSVVSRRDFVRMGLYAAAFSALGLAGCNGRSAAGGSDARLSAAVTVIDCMGRHVDVPEEPERISVMDSFAGELAIMIGAGPALVGVPSGVVSDELLRGIYPALANVPAPMSNGAVNMEEYMAAHPQVAIVKRDIYETDDQAALLDAAGVPYVVVGYETMDEQIAMMRLVGSVCGGSAQKRADDLAVLYEDIIAQCRERVSDLPEDRRVRVYHAINALTMTDGASSLGADWVAAAGCVDVSAEYAETATETDFVTTLEQIFDWDPDAFICNNADTTDYLLEKDSCASLRAVKAGRCYTIPVGATRWGQRGSVETYLAMLWLGVTMYPDRYRDFDLKAFIADYYRDYLGIEIDDDTYELMLSGRGLRQLPK